MPWLDPEHSGDILGDQPQTPPRPVPPAQPFPLQEMLAPGSCCKSKSIDREAIRHLGLINTRPGPHAHTVPGVV